MSGTAEVATNATPPVATAVRNSVRISVATGSAGDGEQRVDIGDEQHAAAVANGGHRGRHAGEPVLGAQRTHLGAVQFDEPPVGADRPHHGGLADTRGPGHQHAEIGCGAECFEELRLVECQLEPFGQPGGLGVCALEVVEADGAGRRLRRAR